MINWQLTQSLSTDQCHGLLYRGTYKDKEVQKEVHTPIYKYQSISLIHPIMQFGKEDVWYFILGDKREFRTEAELKKAIEEG